MANFKPYIFLTILISGTSSLKVMELMAPYKILSVASNQYLTTHEQGILGLRTGIVKTAPDYGKLATEQQWTLSWDPTIDRQHDGYRIESGQEYLNDVTAFYPDGRTRAIPNIWEIIELSDGKKILKNKRSQKCLTVLKLRVDVVERTCSFKNRYQQWKLQRLDLDKRLRRRGDFYPPGTGRGNMFGFHREKFQKYHEDQDDSEEQEESYY